MTDSLISKKIKSLASQLSANMNPRLIPGIQAQLLSLVKDLKALEEENCALKSSFQEPKPDV